MLKTYLPLIIVVGLATMMAFAICHNQAQFSGNIFTRSIMGIFLCLLSMFKFFDISGFVKGFSTYDLIAKHVKPYGYIYPFFELGLGLSFIAGNAPVFTNATTFVLMSISSFGVIRSVKSGMNLRCACLGTVLNVPLSTVSIVENLGMGIMALINVIWLLKDNTI